MVIKMDKKIKLIAIVGPTASGKTALSVNIAEKTGGEIVSADSMQIYKGMGIGTAKPDETEKRGIPHHLMDFLEPDAQYSVAKYTSDAREIIKDIHGRGKIPVIAGGTGLYVSSLLNNIEFSEHGTDEKYRAELAAVAEKDGGAALLGLLRDIDPETADRLPENDRKRIIRALEVYRVTGITMSEHIGKSQLNPSPYDPLIIGLDFRDRQTLYDRINRRVDDMMEKGLLKEAETVLKSNQKTASQAIGYKELIPYLDGQSTLSEAVENIKMETRRYAKRQLTWFRRDKRAQWLFVDDYESFGDVADAAAGMVKAHFEQTGDV